MAITSDKWLLAMDTAAETVSAAVTTLSGDFSMERAANEKKQHTEKLLPVVDDLMRKLGIRPANAEAFAFSAGPGAFTGVRTACAAAQGLAWALEKPVIIVPTLAALALQLFDGNAEARVAMAAVDARMGECYVQIFERPENEDAMPRPLTDPMHVKPESLAAFAALHRVETAGGSAFRAYGEAIGELAGVEIVPEIDATAGVVAEAARRQFLAGDVTTAALAAPIYVRNRVALTIEERRRGERLQ